MKESSLETLVGHYAKQRGCLYWKFVSPGRKGVPDRIIVAPNGRVLFMELKAKGKRPTPLQDHQMGLLREKKAEVCWVSRLEQAQLKIDELCQ